MRTIKHTYKPGETINAVIKIYNGVDIQKDDLEIIKKSYNEINHNEIPQPGTVHEIPIMGHSDE
jgi:hypothetical protein